MFKWLFHILIFATSGKYQNKEKPLKRKGKLGLVSNMSEKITLLTRLFKAGAICIIQKREKSIRVGSHVFFFLIHCTDVRISDRM